MSIDYTALKSQPRLLLEATLKPLQGERFQATGFADLGAALYTLPDGTKKLLVESAQSVANRLEMTIWDEANDKLIEELDGLAYIQVNNPDGTPLTNSILEAHRINSEYVIKSTNGDELFKKTLIREMKVNKKRPISRKEIINTIFKYDTNSIIHGCFLEELDGRIRLTRILSGFIEAEGVKAVESGGVKINHIEPSLKGGAGNVPFHRTEYVAETIKAYFNIDTSLIRSYPLADHEKELIIAVSLFKIVRFLNSSLRLRTACVFEIIGDIETKPKIGEHTLNEEFLQREISKLLDLSKSNSQGVTSITFIKDSAPIVVELTEAMQNISIPEDVSEFVTVKKQKDKPAKLEISSDYKDTEELFDKLHIDAESEDGKRIAREVQAARIYFDDEELKISIPKKFKDEIKFIKANRNKSGCLTIYSPDAEPDELSEMLAGDDADLQQRIYAALIS